MKNQNVRGTSGSDTLKTALSVMKGKTPLSSLNSMGTKPVKIIRSKNVKTRKK